MQLLLLALSLTSASGNYLTFQSIESTIPYKEWVCRRVLNTQIYPNYQVNELWNAGCQAWNSFGINDNQRVTCEIKDYSPTACSECFNSENCTALDAEIDRRACAAYPDDNALECEGACAADPSNAQACLAACTNNPSANTQACVALVAEIDRRACAANPDANAQMCVAVCAADPSNTQACSTAAAVCTNSTNAQVCVCATDPSANAQACSAAVDACAADPSANAQACLAVTYTCTVNSNANAQVCSAAAAACDADPDANANAQYCDLAYGVCFTVDPNAQACSAACTANHSNTQACSAGLSTVGCTTLENEYNARPCGCS